jgi:hypothetical protein
MYSNYKIAVHITFFLGKNYLNRINFLRKIIVSYKKISKNLDIFIHINKKLHNKYKIKDVNYILHNLSLEDPYLLSWKSRKLIYEQKDIYDVFIYSEDDILFTKNNIIYIYLCVLMQFYMQGWKVYFLHPFCAGGRGGFIDYP